MPKRTKRGKYWSHYIRDLADRMELRDWSIVVMKKPTPKSAGAGLRCTYGRKIMAIKLAPDFNELAPERQRHYLVHELVHVHLWGVNQAMADARANHPKRWMKMLELTVQNAEEYGVDALAEIIAKSMPFPPTKEQTA